MKNKDLQPSLTELELEERRLEKSIKKLFSSEKFSIIEYAYIGTTSDEKVYDQATQNFILKIKPVNYVNYLFLFWKKDEQTGKYVDGDISKDLRIYNLEIKKTEFKQLNLKDAKNLIFDSLKFDYKFILFVLKVFSRFRTNPFFTRYQNVTFSEKDKNDFLKKIRKSEKNLEKFLEKYNYSAREFNLLIDWMQNLKNSEYIQDLKSDKFWFEHLPSHMLIFNKALNSLLNERLLLISKKIDGDDAKQKAKFINDRYSEISKSKGKPIFLISLEFLEWIIMHRNNNAHDESKFPNLDTNFEKTKSLVVLNQLKIVVFQIIQITKLISSSS